MKRNALIVVMVAIFTDMLMYGLIVPFLPNYAVDLGASDAEIGFLFASYAITLFLGTFLFGVIGDRIGKKKLIIYGLIALALTTLFFAYATSFWLLILARSLQGFAAAIPWTAGLALIAEVYDRNERGKAMGLAMSGQALGILLGPPLGGWFFDLGGFQLPFFITAAIAFLAAVYSIVALRNVVEHKLERIQIPFRLITQPQILIVAGYVAIGSSIFSALEPTLPLHLEETFNITPTVIGLLFMAISLVYGIVSPFIGEWSTRIGYTKMLMLGVLFLAVLLPVTTLPSTLWLQAVILALLGLGLGAALTPTLPLLADITQSNGIQSHSMTFALYNIVYSIGMIIGPILTTVLSGSFGLTFAYIVLAVVFLMYLLPLARLKYTASTSTESDSL